MFKSFAPIYHPGTSLHFPFIYYQSLFSFQPIEADEECSFIFHSRGLLLMLNPFVPNRDVRCSSLGIQMLLKVLFQYPICPLFI